MRHLTSPLARSMDWKVAVAPVAVLLATTSRQSVAGNFQTVFNANPAFVEKATTALDTAILECNARIGQGIAMRKAIAADLLPASAGAWDD